MNLDLNNLTLDNVGMWPTPIKGIVVGLVFILISFFGYWFYTSQQLQQLQTLHRRQAQLLLTLKNKQQQAAGLESYRAQIKQIDELFHDSLRRLPTKTEVPGLLEDITKMGVANGLEFRLFKPLPETKSAFYSELPIQISVIGDYHQLAKFISDIANLDRIVTLHDFSIEPVRVEGGQSADVQGRLKLDIRAKTYRYTEGASQQ